MSLAFWQNAAFGSSWSEALPSSKIDGVCLWLDQHSPVIGMSLRFDRIDNFWFVLGHEIEHALKGARESRP